MSLLMFTDCRDHEDCTLCLEFSEPGTPGVDVIADLKPFPSYLVPHAQRDFPGTVCTRVHHEAGVLQLARVEGGE